MSPATTQVTITTKNLAMISVLDWCATTFDGVKKKKGTATCFSNGKGWRKEGPNPIGPGQHTFYFDNPNDAALFALRWC